jgi:hypothetical protein
MVNTVVIMVITVVGVSCCYAIMVITVLRVSDIMLLGS